MSRVLVIGCIFFSAVAVAQGAGRARYRVVLADGRVVRAADAPAVRGSVVVFHRYPGGALTGFPSEEVVRVEALDGSRAVRVLEQDAAVGEREDLSAAQPLRPGDAVDVGVTGGSPAAAVATAPAPVSVPGGVYDPRMAFYGGSVSAPGVNALAASNAAAAAAAAAPSSPFAPPIGSNGFPAPAPTTTVTETNGSFAFSMVPGSANVVIGPDGTPEMANPGTPGATPVIGPNGTPIIASDGTLAVGVNGTPVVGPGVAGSTLPVGPNGMPVLAPGGAPGSTAPTIGANGTPVLAPGAPAAPVIGPNGFPVPSAPPAASAATPHR